MHAAASTHNPTDRHASALKASGLGEMSPKQAAVSWLAERKTTDTEKTFQAVRGDITLLGRLLHELRGDAPLGRGCGVEQAWTGLCWEDVCGVRDELEQKVTQKWSAWTKRRAMSTWRTFETWLAQKGYMTPGTLVQESRRGKAGGRTRPKTEPRKSPLGKLALAWVASLGRGEGTAEKDLLRFGKVVRELKGMPGVGVRASLKATYEGLELGDLTLLEKDAHSMLVDTVGDLLADRSKKTVGLWLASLGRGDQVEPPKKPQGATLEMDELLYAWEQEMERATKAEKTSVELKKLLAGLEKELCELREEIAALEPELPTNPPRTVTEAVNQAAALCTFVEFHPDARATAKTCVYQKPQAVLADLLKLDSILNTWRNQGLAGSLAMACREAGIDWRADISDTAKTSYKSDYTHTIDGELRVCGAHIARGSNSPPTHHVRLHFWVDTETRRVILCYVGKHLRDATNR